MAVRPFRAILAAQGQATWNRLMREGGEASVVAAALVAGLVAVAVAPLVLAGATMGSEAGRAMAAGRPASFAAAVAVGLGLMLAALGGVLEHQLAFAVEGFRVWPVSRPTLFAAELASGQLGALAVLATGFVVAFHAALAVRVPRALPLVVLAGAQAVLWVLLVQHVVGGLKRRALSGRLFLPLAAVGVVTAAGGFAAVRALEAGGHAKEVIRALGVLVAVPPFAAAFRGIEEALGGRWGAALGGQAALAGATAALALAVFAFHFSGQGREAPSRGAGDERLWSFRGPARGVARLFQAEVVGHRAGRVGLGFAVVFGASLAVVAGVFARAPEIATAPWPVRLIAEARRLPLFGLYMVLVPTLHDELWRNQFGWSGPGVRTLFLLPLAPERLLLGRMLGLLRLNALQAALGAGPLLLAYRPPLSEVAWGIAAGLTGCVAIGAIGHLVSARFPRPMRDQFLGSAATPLVAFLIPLAVQVPLFSILVIAYQLGARAGPWGSAAAMGLLAAVTLGLYLRVLPFLGRRVMALRETLIEELA